MRGSRGDLPEPGPQERQVIVKTNRITRIVELFTDAIAAAAAVETGHQPRAKNLKGLGIDPEQFRKIGR